MLYNKKNMRKLLNNELVEELEEPVNLIIHTKVPAKWKIIDMETGEEYIGCSTVNQKFIKMLIDKIQYNKIGHWQKIKNKEFKK